jgi:hypothetical protein
MRIVWWWGLANLSARALVFSPVIPFSERPVTSVAMYAAQGPVIAVPQHWLLVKWCRQPLWHLPLCACGWAVALWMSDREGFFGPAVQWLAIVGAPVAAVVQYAGMRACIRRALWWVPATIGSMLLAAWVGIQVGYEAFDHAYRWDWFFDRGYYATAGGAAGGATYGLLSGLALAALLADRHGQVR